MDIPEWVRSACPVYVLRPTCESKSANTYVQVRFSYSRPKKVSNPVISRPVISLHVISRLGIPGREALRTINLSAVLTKSGYVGQG